MPIRHPSRVIAAVAVTAALAAAAGGARSWLTSTTTNGGSRIVPVGRTTGGDPEPGPSPAAIRPVPPADGSPGLTLRILHRRIAFHEAPAILAADAVRAGPNGIHAAGGILVDIDSGRILWAHDPHLALPPASTTKVLTSLVALDSFSPTQEVTVTAAALHEAPDETIMGVRSGQRFTIAELLTGMLLVSGNDAANTIAAGTSGFEAFVAAMNAQLEALGLDDSHFTTPVGLDDARQRASAYDLAVIATADVDNFPLFAQIVRQTHVSLPATAGHPAFDLTNLNQLLLKDPWAVGIKPGWTGDAGPCMVGMGVRGGHRLISVLLNAPLVAAQSQRLLDWGFAQEGVTPP